MYLSLKHQQQCLTRPIQSSLMTGGVLTAFSALQSGVGPQLPVVFATNVSIIYG
jgi:hypothetical protein